jgi:hypothetical protein
MDISEEYGSMCREAKEIQVLWNKEYGDFVACKGMFGLNIRTIFDGADNEYSESTPHISPDYLYISDCIWLPRQDQLQAMITDCGYFRFSLIELFYRFNCTVYHSAHTPSHIFASMEQMWLAFVMHHTFKKKWNGSKWIQ